ncbi:DUF6338 family protein [Mycobacterium haemophilum]|uniref:DUF6338 family protein n=1 Tax=Mycobacterium haemophilum TaxID=29311 RepID=UPI000699B6AD|nr:DUF6338 family protein [Mycobacterium haemophilum]
MLVTGWQHALTVLVIVIPGFVYQTVRSRFQGPTPDDGDLGVRVLRALATSGLFALAYLIALGPILTNAISHPQSYLSRTRYTALLLFVLVFLLPAAAAAGLYAHRAHRLYPQVPWTQLFRIYNPTPTAWDFAVNRGGPGYVRVLTNDGSWVGGYAGENSFYTNFPQPREAFVETAWRLSEEGEFVEKIRGSTGLWIRCDDARIVEFLQPEPAVTAGQRILETQCEGGEPHRERIAQHHATD